MLKVIIIFMSMLLIPLNCINWFKPEISVGDIIAITGIIVAVWQFCSQIKRGRQISEQQQKETWFLSVIVLPQLDAIKKHYEEVLLHLIEDRGRVKSIAEDKSYTHNQFLAEMAKLKNDRKEEINKYFDHLIALVRSFDENLGSNVNEIVMELEDKYVQILDLYGNDSEINKNEKEIILSNEQKLITILNRGLSRNTKK